MVSFEQLAGEHGVHGAVLGISGDAGSWLFNLGMPPEARLAIASVTKPLVAAGLGAAGVDLDASVASLVPELNGGWAEEATIRDLLRCSSGIGVQAGTEWGFDDDGDDGVAAFCRSVGTVDPHFAPAERWAYSNTGFVVAARALETTTGRPWDEALHDLLLAPLGMTATSGAVGAASYGVDGREEQAWRHRALGPGGSWLSSSVPDLLRFGAHLQQLEWLRADPRPLGFHHFVDAWCTGLARFDWNGATAFGWDGIAAGARAILRFVPERSTVIAFLCDTANGRDLWRDVAEHLLPDLVGFGQAPVPEPMPVEDLGRYEGRYAWSDLAISVRAGAGGLEIGGLGEPLLAVPIDEANFVVGPPTRPAEVISFSSFEAGQPQMLHLKVWGFPRRSSDHRS